MKLLLELFLIFAKNNLITLHRTDGHSSRKI